MFENNPAVDLSVGRSSVRQRILALLMDESTGRLHLREIQRRAGTSPGTASRELGKLVAAGLIEREAEGNQVYFRACTSPFATMLRSLLVAMPAPDFGPRPPGLPRPKTARTAATSRTAPGIVETPAAASGDTAGVPAIEAAGPEAAPVGPAEASLETAPAQEPTGADAGPRVIWPAALAEEWAVLTSATADATTSAPPTPDPLGLLIAGRLAEAIRPMYGPALRGLYLYGARASGPTAAEADVETIVVLDRVEHYGAELERTSHACAELSHDANVIVSRIFVSEPDWNGGPNGVLPPIRSEAVAV